MPSIKGTDGDDLIFADGAAERVYGRAGNDTIYGDQWLAEQLWGGDGNDWLISGSGDITKGARGDDVLVSTVGGDILVGGVGNDTLLGGGTHTEMFGGVGDDTIRVFQGRGFGQGGNDILIAEDKQPAAGLPAYLDGGRGTDQYLIALTLGEPYGFKAVIEKLEAGETVGIRLDDAGGVALLYTDQIYDTLDSNNDGRIDATDGFDANTGWGVTTGSGDTYQGVQLNLHIGWDEVAIGGIDHLDFMVG